MKYSVDGETVLVDDEPVARIEVLQGELNVARIAELISAANRGTCRPRPTAASSQHPATVTPGLVDDIDETGAGGFLAAHHVPIIGPEVGMELIKVLRRIEVVQRV
jgi:hypothetical protein